ncbi:MAG: hypothetical protein AB7F88_06200 [Pyrinomonadaceae bacterium]
MKNQALLFAFVAFSLLFIGLSGVSAQEHDSGVGVKDGGISVKGWTGEIDAKEKAAGSTLNSAKFVKEGKGFHITTGPAVTYWNPKNTAKGDYTVSATFHEPKYMSINDHPHPYGIMIGGHDIGTEKQSYLYCAAYGNGTFIFRGFGPEPFQLGGRRPTADPAVNKAGGVGQPVTQEIAITVKGDAISCSINKKQVASFPRSEVVAPGKLRSTDGVYGLRFGHNTDATVSDLKVTKAQ